MKKFFKVLFYLMIVSALVLIPSCSDSDDGGTPSDETSVTKYTYNLTSNQNYYIVDEFHCVDNGDNTYDVKTAYRHFFKNTSENYKNKTGQELINLIKTKSVTATTSKSGTQTSAATQPVKNSAGEVTWTYNIPAGMSYTVYYYE